MCRARRAGGLAEVIAGVLGGAGGAGSEGERYGAGGGGFGDVVAGGDGIVLEVEGADDEGGAAIVTGEARDEEEIGGLKHLEDAVFGQTAYVVFRSIHGDDGTPLRRVCVGYLSFLTAK
jgi:hypothetical protein